MGSSFDKKLTQLQLQHTIYTTLSEDNGVSSHFDYHVNLMSDDETVKLNLLTFNERHNEYMLFHSTTGTSSINCLEKMVAYIKSLTNDEYSYTIRWSRKGENNKHVSYFIAKNSEEALSKFLHEKKEDEFDFEVLLNPIS